MEDVQDYIPAQHTLVLRDPTRVERERERRHHILLLTVKNQIEKKSSLPKVHILELNGSTTQL